METATKLGNSGSRTQSGTASLFALSVVLFVIGIVKQDKLLDRLAA